MDEQEKYQEKYYRDQMRKAGEMAEVLGKLMMVVLAFAAGYLVSEILKSWS